MQSTTAAITVGTLKKSYKKVEVLKGVSFTVEKGTIFALLGANGAGKTTTINILTTLLAADSGTAMVNGYDVAKQPAGVRNSISLTGQFAAVDPMLTARENLMLIAELRHVKQPGRVAMQLLEQFDLVDAVDRYASTFSGGMRRRLDIAMSLIGNPAIIFLDEPTTGLDPQSRTAMWQTIKALADSGITVFLTTQYLEEADQLADTIAVLAGGTIVAQGTPGGLKKLLPSGQVELRFNDEVSLRQATKLLVKYQPITNEADRSLTVSTDGSVGQLARLFALIEAAKINVSEFSQKQSTLDDAFLKIINDHKEKN